MNDGHVIKIAPSILAADFSRLGDELARLEDAGADMAHIDVMDGAFVPNITIGPPVIKALRAVSKLPFDVHLMIEKPERYIEAFVEAGASVVTVHVEACAHIGRVLRSIRALGASPAVALCPHTPLSSIEWIIESVDMVLLMTVDPGFGGQKFLESSIKKLGALRLLAAARGVCPDVEVDGGITRQNAERIAKAGANVFVAGSALFAADDIKDAVYQMREAAQSGGLNG